MHDRRAGSSGEPLQVMASAESGGRREVHHPNRMAGSSDCAVFPLATAGRTFVANVCRSARLDRYDCKLAISTKQFHLVRATSHLQRPVASK
jgi:hypothetical protein